MAGDHGAAGGEEEDRLGDVGRRAGALHQRGADIALLALLGPRLGPRRIDEARRHRVDAHLRRERDGERADLIIAAAALQKGSQSRG